MRVLLTTLNAKFIHSSLALRSIKKYCEKYPLILKEFTINQNLDLILADIFKLKPDIICFSCYIWNIEMTKQLLLLLRKVLPDSKIILGGPEVSYEYEYLLDNNYCDLIVCGEGEQTFLELMEHFFESKNVLADINGIAFIKNNKIVATPKRVCLNLDHIPFPYDNLDDLDNRIIYYESSRGCPFGCSYCLSSIEKGVRFLSVSRTFQDLGFFLANKVKQVKFVDRTFNCDKKRTLELWKFLIENDNSITNFHFEISADLLTDDMFEVLKSAREGLFQFEIGVQSTNTETLKAINRSSDLDLLFGAVKKIQSLKNIHLHLDLIAGLPLEDFSSFKKSFNNVYALAPDQLQLGFLKVLRGSQMYDEAEDYGIQSSPIAPYSILYNSYLSFEEMLTLKDVEETLDIFYNSEKFHYTLKFLDIDFDFYFDFSKFLNNCGFFHIQHNKMDLYTIFYEYCKNKYPEKIGYIKEFLIFDIYSKEGLKNLPDWVGERDIKEESRNFFENSENIEKYVGSLSGYTNKQISRLCRLEKFNVNIIKWINSDFSVILEEDSFVLFNYPFKTFCEVKL